MSPSWNFPARAEPSYEGSEPSRAELGHFNFRAETELKILTIYLPKLPIMCLYFDFMFNSLLYYVQFYEFVSGIFGVKHYDLGTLFNHFQVYIIKKSMKKKYKSKLNFQLV